MHNKIFKATLIGATLLVAPNAMAQNWYLGGAVGYNQTSDATSEGPNRVVDVSFDEGYILSSIVGYDFGNNFRLEGAFDSRNNDGESLSFNNVDRPFTSKGNVSYSLIGSLYYDFPVEAAFTPYIGAGLGISYIENEFFYGAVDFDDSDTAFAWQVAAGGSTSFSDRIDLFVEAKYFSAVDPEFVRTSPMDSGISLESEYDNLSVSVGYRFKL